MLKIFVTEKFEVDFKKIPAEIKIKTEFALNALKQNPYTSPLDIKKLKGLGKNFWRLKINRNYRLIYSITKNSLILHRIRQRKDIYRGF